MGEGSGTVDKEAGLHTFSKALFLTSFHIAHLRQSHQSSFIPVTLAQSVLEVSCFVAIAALCHRRDHAATACNWPFLSSFLVRRKHIDFFGGFCTRSASRDSKFFYWLAFIISVQQVPLRSSMRRRSQMALSSKLVPETDIESRFVENNHTARLACPY